MNYTVKYKTPKQFFWRKVKKVKGDFILDLTGHYGLVLEDESQILIPPGSEIIFGKGRFWSIKKRKEEEVGQELKVKTNSVRPVHA